MNIDDEVIEVVAEFLRENRVRPDMPVRRMARETLRLVDQVRSGTRPEPTPEEIAAREIESRKARRQNRIAAYERKQTVTGRLRQ